MRPLPAELHLLRLSVPLPHNFILRAQTHPAPTPFRCEFLWVESHYLCHINPTPGTGETLSKATIGRCRVPGCSRVGAHEGSTSLPPAPLAEWPVTRASSGKFSEIHQKRKHAR